MADAGDLLEVGGVGGVDVDGVGRRFFLGKGGKNRGEGKRKQGEANPPERNGDAPASADNARMT